MITHLYNKNEQNTRNEARKTHNFIYSQKCSLNLHSIPADPNYNSSFNWGKMLLIKKLHNISKSITTTSDQLDPFQTDSSPDDYTLVQQKWTKHS